MPVDLNLPEIQEAIAKEAEKISSAKIEEATAGLKAKNTELLDEVKNIKRKFDGIDPEEFKQLKGKKRDDDDKNSDPAQLRARIEEEYKPKLDQAETRAAEAEKKLNGMVVDSQLTAALLESGVAKDFIRAVKADLTGSRKVEVSDNGVLVDGKPAADFVKAWAATDGKPFIAAANNSGGGAQGGSGGAASAKKASEMTRTEKAEFIANNGLKAFQDKVTNESK